MDYVVGSVAALVSGNITPSRPRHLKVALTPTKHQPSPNVTPKSEFVTDRSIFLSPTLQKKKAIIKKSPKRIFENPDLDVTGDNEGNLSSPKADKVRKHLKSALEANTSLLSPESTDTISEMVKVSPNKKSKVLDVNNKNQNENTPKKKKLKRVQDDADVANIDIDNCVSPKKKKKLSKSNSNNKSNVLEVNKESLQNLKKNKKLKSIEKENSETENIITMNKKPKKKNQNDPGSLNAISNINEKKKLKKKSKQKVKHTIGNNEENSKVDEEYVNPNAITYKDTDSEHESDDEMVSENEEHNDKKLQPLTAESSDEEDNAESVKKEKVEEVQRDLMTEEEIKRTIFVGNVPLSKKCKKEIKQIFIKYGRIETVRIRTVPVKDASVTPKMAIIKSDLHPDRSTVNVYIKFADEASVTKALAANNTVLHERHLRVTRSDSTGAEHDPNLSVFVGNLPFALEDEVLRAKFEKCGEIESVRIIRDKRTNAGKGFGYVNFVSKDGVELALAMTDEDLTIKNRIIRVKRCTQTAQRKSKSVGKTMQKNTERRNQLGKGKFQMKHQNKSDGAQRRVANKRTNQEKGEGPPIKRSREGDQPLKEKKQRKEFVGLTAEKKKKNKFNKGQKKKKELSEILTK